MYSYSNEYPFTAIHIKHFLVRVQVYMRAGARACSFKKNYLTSQAQQSTLYSYDPIKSDCDPRFDLKSRKPIF